VIAVSDLSWPSAWGWAMLLGIGVCAGLGQITATLGYASGETSLVMAFDFLKLPIAATISMLILGEAPDRWTWIGAVVIFVAAWAMVRNETRKT
jgi:drug/metabolite transporter (DMT)-like permease